MKKVILFLNDLNTISIVFPTGELAIEYVAKKDIPKGKPFKYVDFDNLPPNLDDVQADFTNPDGFGEKELEAE